MLNANQLNSIGFSHIITITEPCSPYGVELARYHRFYSHADFAELEAELTRVETLMKLFRERTQAFEKVERILMQFKDVRRSIERTKLFTLSDVEFFEIKRFLILLERLASAYSELTDEIRIEGINIGTFTKALDIIDQDGMRSMTFRVSDRSSEELARIRKARHKLDLELRNAAASDKERICIEITALAAREENEEAVVRSRMTKELAKYAGGILSTVDSVACLDFAMAKARMGVKQNAIIPVVKQNGKSISFSKMRNPAIDETLKDKGKSFTPIDISLCNGSTVITGANMGGKSVTAKTLALNTLLALSGFPVFASSAEIMCLCDIELLSDDKEDTLSGLSSFGGEMVSFNKMIEKNRQQPYLVLLDEFARGTNPHEGAALVRAAVKYFNQDGYAFALITTHFDDIARFAKKHYQVMGLKNANMRELLLALSAGGERKVRVLENFMDYGIFEVPNSMNPPRDAITICHALGVNDEFMSLVEE